MAASGQFANEKVDPLDPRTVINSAPALIHTSQPDGYLDFFNETWLTYVGQPLEHLQGWKWTAFIHPDDVEGIVAKWRASLASGDPFLYEARVLRADGQYRWMLHHKVALHNQQGEIIKWHGSSIDIESRKRAEEALQLLSLDLQESKTRLEEAQRIAHVGHWVFDLGNDELTWSDETYRIFGLRPQERPMNVEAFQEMIHPEDRGFLLQATQEFRGGGRPDIEFRIVRPSGEVRIAHSQGAVMRDVPGQPRQRFGTVQDITDRKHAEEALQQSQFYLSEGQRLAHIGSWALDPAGFDYWSPELFRMHGLDPASKAPTIQEYLDILHPQDRESMADLIKGILANASPFDATKRIVRPNGEVRYIRCVGAPVTETQSLKKYVGSAIDVTDHELLTQELRRREAYLAEAQKLSHTGSFGWKPDSGEIVWTDETYRIFEYDRAEKPTLNMVLQRIHPQDRPFAQQVIDRASETGTDFEHEYRLVMPSGTIKHIHVKAHTLSDSSGNFEVVGAVTDITERKTTEDKIRRLVDANILGIFIGNFEGLIIEANDAFLRMVQYGREDVSSGRLRWTDLTPPEWRERDERAVEEAKANGTIQPYEREYFRKDGSRVPVMIGSALFEGSNEGVVFVLDLSERKRGDEALRSSEAYLAEAQRLSQTASWAWSAATGQPSYWSKECYRVLGFNSAEPLPLQEAFIQQIHPDDQTSCRQQIEKGIRDKLDFEFDYRIVHPDKGVRDIHCVCHPVLDQSGGLVELVGTIIDITEQKAAEEKIREQEMELRQMLDLTPQHVAVFGPAGERLYANRVTLDYIGLSLDEWLQTPGGPSRPGWYIHPDDRDRSARGYSDANLSGGSALEMELRIQGVDGNYRWFLVRFNPLRDDKGQVKRWYVASTDIDDRKRAEEKLQLENAALREEIDQTSMFEEIVGTSPALQPVLSRISKVAPSDSTVLITGETGTGKELVARAIHRRSKRSGRAFVCVNCAAIPHDLITSELFGHEKGAFTGAMQRRLGRFEMADGGTIFLDEIGELSPDTQVALLRVLQEREFERVGGGQSIHVDVRVIAATNRDLQAAVANGTFRQDLFYRLNVFPIDVPPLRERRDDILMLVEYFAQRYASRAGKAVRSIEKKTLELLQSYEWPGNIRELQNVIERSVILSSDEILSVDKMWLSQKTPQPASRVEVLPRLDGDAEPRSEREIIEAALAESRGRVSGPSGAAAKLGIPPSTLDNRIRALNINKRRFKFGLNLQN
jgi:PAS domain S-box-containing protein